MVETLRTESVAETEAVAARLAAELTGGACIALDGELGAGKTQFVRGLVRALGGPAGAVCSPTFVLLNVYPGGRLTVYHLDAYRAAGAEDLEAIGFSELLEQDGVVVVEWARRIESLLPKNCLRVSIEAIGPTARRLEITRPD